MVAGWLLGGSGWLLTGPSQNSPPLSFYDILVSKYGQGPYFNTNLWDFLSPDFCLGVKDLFDIKTQLGGTREAEKQQRDISVATFHG